MLFIEVKSLAGVNYIRASDVLAVQYSDREKCTLIFTGGVTLQCTEAASAVAARIEAAMGAPQSTKSQPETLDAHAGK